MDTSTISARLHDILRTACRVRQPGPGIPADAGLSDLAEVKAGLRDLISSLGEIRPPRLPPRIHATASAFPKGRIAGTRALVQHRRRTRATPGKDNTAVTSRAADGDRHRPSMISMLAAAELCFGKAGVAPKDGPSSRDR
ncbi:hypothetical protein MKK68_03865 [Methylobacterium sp. E-016]|uniref:hypothetical protein n=1 Tax=Methylobacterium sp. E-016 TaxID=2836556 RepID=UPI001FB95631|nr:hypothetical protein [Methylobacterium sp. E-016]MCJ2074788.1 hypothetical protein [Methylobacterium sp. E-016]